MNRPIRFKSSTIIMSLFLILIIWIFVFFFFASSSDFSDISNEHANSIIILSSSNEESRSSQDDHLGDQSDDGGIESVKPVVERVVEPVGNVLVDRSVVDDRGLPVAFFGRRMLDDYEVIDGVDDKREAVRDAFKFAWDGYSKYAWGKDEIKPVSNRGDNNWGGLGATIVDSIDTILIMNLEEDYQKARNFIQNLNFRVDYDCSTFETTIRFLGGLEAAHSLTGDEMFLRKAVELADRLLPAFNSPTGIPYSTVNLKTGKAHSPSWSAGSSFLAEFGTLQLEFKYLSHWSNEPIYKQKVQTINDLIFAADVSKWGGLYPIKFHPVSGSFQQSEIKFGARGDSFYEYLLKQYLQTKKTDDYMKGIYDRAISAVIEKLILKTKTKGLTYIAEMNGDRHVHKMDHLACFAAGMFALDGDAAHLILAEEIMETCYEFYSQNPSGLAPEIAGFEPSRVPEGKDFYNDASHYILRPGFPFHHLNTQKLSRV
eukprot:TRINITY_DN947_c0_g1_i2.p1 TRINITY_DN947_c0_g1~~TRINITY_DN947_c0_g1_i2.p1  ORF type:complete len:485 (+),score=85.87 TRINITY_DN947_c0_g1_i2:35-1489(+)